MSQSLSTKDYLRVRFGIGRPPGRQDPADYVLSDFTAAERKELEFLVDRSADIVESIITHGLEHTQNVFHAGLTPGDPGEPNKPQVALPFKSLASRTILERHSRIVRLAGITPAGGGAPS